MHWMDGAIFLVLWATFIGGATAYYRAKRRHEEQVYDWEEDGL